MRRVDGIVVVVDVVDDVVVVFVVVVVVVVLLFNLNMNFCSFDKSTHALVELTQVNNLDAINRDY